MVIGSMITKCNHTPGPALCHGCSTSNLFYSQGQDNKKLQARIATLKADLASLQFAASTYIRTHKNQRVRFQDADDAGLYTEAAIELERVLCEQVLRDDQEREG